MQSCLTGKEPGPWSDCGAQAGKGPGIVRGTLEPGDLPQTEVAGQPCHSCWADLCKFITGSPLPFVIKPT